MFNTMSDSSRRGAIEHVIANGESSVTDFIQLFRDSEFRPSTQICVPIFSQLNSSTVVGIISISFSWDSFFSESLVENVEGIYFILSTKSAKVTYRINGKKVLILKGDNHDPAYNDMKHTISLSTVVRGGSQYTIEAYPSDDMYNAFMTDNPRNAAVIIVTASISFLLLLAHIRGLVVHQKKEKELLIRSSAESEFTDFLAHEVTSYTFMRFFNC
jgi:CHASE1-domain containing sensor protein